MRNSVSNMEHYKADIIKALNEGYKFKLVNGKISKCSGCDEICGGCTFFDGKGSLSCDRNTLLWLIEDYEEPIMLTARESHFVEFTEIGYMARDKNNNALYYYFEKPYRETSLGIWRNTDETDAVEVDLFGCGMFSFITWEDEPWSIEKLRRFDVKE